MVHKKKLLMWKEKIPAIHDVTVKDSQANAALHNTYLLYLNNIPVLNPFFYYLSTVTFNNLPIYIAAQVSYSATSFK